MKFLYCLLLSILYLSICTKSSPLYPFNDWVDSNAFFTMGKGMMKGKVLYRDLFEQKGPLLYFIHGISYLISNKTFFGVFIFELLSFTVFLYFCYKSLNLFIDVKYSYISLVFIAYIVLNMPSFSHGDSAEEFSISLLAISLYFLLNYFINIYPKEVNYKTVLVNGIIAGCILWIKYSLLGFWLGWMASIFFCLVYSKHYIYSIKCCVLFILGMIISTIPWIFYFGINNSITDLIYVYFFVNINIYSEAMPFFQRIIFALKQVIEFSVYNAIFGILFIFSLLFFTFYNRFIRLKLHRICILLCIFMLTLGVYGGGRNYIYYYFIYSPFIVFGIVSIIDFIKVCINNKKTLSKVTLIILNLTTIIITLITSFLFNHNTYMINIKKEDLFHYKFEKIISETENASLLNYGCLDLGVYTTTGITPDIRFFMRPNNDYSKFPLNINEQNNYIKEKKTDYVVMARLKSQKQLNISNPYLIENYELISSETYKYETIEYEYLLFKKIE